MVMMIGLFTMGALVWLLASCMAREADAENQRVVLGAEHVVPPTDDEAGEKARQAA
jgi:hypothetical protein